jgi:hypothetical protein
VDNTPESVLSETQTTMSEGVQRGVGAAVEVSGIVVEQASEVGSQVSTVADRLVDDAKAQLRGRAETQLGQLAESLDLLHRQTRALAQGEVNQAGPLVDFVQEGADWLGDLAERIHKGGLDGVVVDLKRFARKRPVVFLSGSALAGLAIGRLLRNEAAAVQARLARGQVPAGETGGSAEVGPGSPPESDGPSAEPVSAEPVGEAGQ